MMSVTIFFSVVNGPLSVIILSTAVVSIFPIYRALKLSHLYFSFLLSITLCLITDFAYQHQTLIHSDINITLNTQNNTVENAVTKTHSFASFK